MQELLARGEFELALPQLREIVRRRYSSGEIPPGKRFPSFVFTTKQENEQCEEDLFALAMWECKSNDQLAADVALLERAVLLHANLQFSTLACWLALKTRPGLPAEELDQGRKLVEMYIPPCLKAGNKDMFVRLVQILCLSEALKPEAAVEFLNKEEHCDFVDLKLIEQRVKQQRMVQQQKPVVNKEEEEKAEEVPTTAQELVEEFAKLHPAQQPPPQQPKRNDLLLQREQALMAAAGSVSLLVLFILMRFRKRLASAVFNLGDLLFGQ